MSRRFVVQLKGLHNCLHVWSQRCSSHWSSPVLFICILQPILAAVRPHPDAKYRPVFNWTHWVFGTLGHVLSSKSLFHYYFPIFGQLTKTDTCANSADLDETAHNEPSHLGLRCLPFIFCFWWQSPLQKHRDERVKQNKVSLIVLLPSVNHSPISVSSLRILLPASGTLFLSVWLVAWQHVSSGKCIRRTECLST